MGILTITNYIAMGVGYAFLALILLFALWIFVDMIKDRRQRKKWEKERERQKAQAAESKIGEAKQASNSEQTENKEDELVDESGKLKMAD